MGNGTLIYNCNDAVRLMVFEELGAKAPRPVRQRGILEEAMQIIGQGNLDMIVFGEGAHIEGRDQYQPSQSSLQLLDAALACHPENNVYFAEAPLNEAGLLREQFRAWYESLDGYERLKEVIMQLMPLTLSRRFNLGKALDRGETILDIAKKAGFEDPDLVERAIEGTAESILTGIIAMPYHNSQITVNAMRQYLPEGNVILLQPYMPKDIEALATPA
ncbi:hypothetical protein KY360_01215 [Candidatus Woesearchaeota archaeon]|nr:hypothetical protein [Candidatus Woesearchaeota archaeon]